MVREVKWEWACLHSHANLTTLASLCVYTVHIIRCRRLNEPNEAAACNALPLSTCLTKCKWFLWRFKSSKRGKIISWLNMLAPCFLCKANITAINYWVNHRSSCMTQGRAPIFISQQTQYNGGLGHQWGPPRQIVRFTQKQVGWLNWLGPPQGPTSGASKVSPNESPCGTLLLQNKWSIVT